MEEQQLRIHLTWNRPLRKIFGSSSLLDGIEVFVDFEWDAVIGHPQKTFTNYMSLGNYVRQKTSSGRQSALLLTDQTGKKEGCITAHDTYDIFIVNVASYKGVAKNDAAGAYFAGLLGSPIIDQGILNKEEISSLLNAIGSAESVGRWIQDHPDTIPHLFSGLADIPLEGAETAKLINELIRRTASFTERDLTCMQTLLGSPNLPSAVLQTAHLSRRQAATSKFKDELQRDEWKESDWQEFFKQEKWIFGHGLLYHFLEHIGDQTYVGGKDMFNQGGNIADYAVRTTAHSASFIALVEIKTPGARLLGSLYRNRVHGMHEELSASVSQIIGSCDGWNREGSKLDPNIRKAIAENWETANPRGILVIGHTRQLDTLEKKRSFELFRRQMHGVEILTFDELLCRAEGLDAPGISNEMPPSAAAA